MKESLYIQSIKRAWAFVKQNKIIWIFGLFAAFLGQFGIVEFLGKIGMASGNTGMYFEKFSRAGDVLTFFAGSFSFSLQDKALVFSLLVLIAAFVAFFIMIAVVSQGTVIGTAAQSIKSRSGKINISKAWNTGVENFWRLFILNFFKKVLISFLAVVVGLSAYTAIIMPSLVNNIIFVVMFLAASAIGLILSFLVIYACAYVVVEKFKIWEATLTAWKLFKDHWLVSIEIGLIILALNMFLGLITALGFVLAILPAILFWFLILAVGGGNLMIASGFIASLVIFAIYLLWIGAVFTVFTTYMWTFAFMKMHKVGIKSRIYHYLSYSKKGGSL
jgi:hypothetical protein